MFVNLVVIDVLAGPELGLDTIHEGLETLDDGEGIAQVDALFEQHPEIDMVQDAEQRAQNGCFSVNEFLIIKMRAHGDR